MSTDPKIEVSAYMGVLRRRWLLLAAPLVVGGALTTFVAMILPPVYKSTARILVESQQIPEELARSTVTSGPVERIRLIEQRLTTRQNLLEVAQRFDIFRDRPLNPSEMVEEMRKAVSIELVALATQGRGNVTASAVNLSFTADRANVAASVVNDLVSKVLEQNLRQRNLRASDTLAFFTQEVERLSQELTQVESRIRQFKIENEDALPDSLGFRRSELARLQERAFERDARRVEIGEQLRLLGDRANAGLAMAEAELTPEQRELAQLRRALVQQRAVYADSHPSIRALTSRIGALESALGSAAATDAPPIDPVALAAAQTQRIVERLERQLTLLDDQEAAEIARIDQLTQSIERTPSVELTLGALVRQQQSLQAQHGAAVRNRSDAETGERLEVSQRAERFEVIEQAQPSPRPESPNRPLIVAAGFLGSGALGFALMVIVEFLNRCIRSASDLERHVGLRPIVSIPYIRTAGEVRRRRWVWRSVAVLTLVITPLVVWLVDRQYYPIQLLVSRAANRIGLDTLIALIESRLGL